MGEMEMGESVQISIAGVSAQVAPEVVQVLIRRLYAIGTDALAVMPRLSLQRSPGSRPAWSP